MDLTHLDQTIINALFTVCGVLIGWMINGIKESIKNARNDHTALNTKVQAIELLVVGNYVKHEDLNALSNAIFAKLDRIETKVDQKMDKHT